ncbi:MAG: hypothetical protein N0A24_03440 [Armatimonadetes bacterium]|nr:hypothetical protein [Armatimonadota bacterium]MDW8153265.1 hypothetical protein [Armatimonadota bacterium]
MRKILQGISLVVVAVLVLAACEQSLGLRLLAPEDNAVISCSSADAGLVRFSWTPVAAARSYTIVIYDGSGNQFLTRTVATTTIDLQLPCGASYSWQVAANPGGTSYWTPRRQFTLGAETFSLITPANGDAVNCITAPKTKVRFAWTVVRDAASYNLVVWNGRGEVAGTANLTGTSTEVELFCGDTYRWQVTAVKNFPSPPVQSPVWTFSITGAPGVTPLQLLSPPDGATIECLAPDNGRVNFDWTDVPNATNYTLEVYRASDGALFLSRTLTASQTTETVVCRPELALQYRWRVGAHMNSQVFWSSFSTFTMTVEKPFLVSPPNGATIPSSSTCNGNPGVLFTWTVVLNATSYRVDVFNSSGALVGSTVVTGATTTSACVGLPMTPGIYTWRVTAIKQAPNPPVTSDMWSFQIVP